MAVPEFFFFLYCLLGFCSAVNPSPLNPRLDCWSISLCNYRGHFNYKAGHFELLQQPLGIRAQKL